MLILGLSDGLRPSAVLVGRGTILAAASQPIGREPTFPDGALRSVLASAGKTLPEVGRVVFGTHISPHGPLAAVGLWSQFVLKESGLWTIAATRRREEGAARLGRRGFRGDVKTIDHFQALAEAAWRSQPIERTLVLTASVGGDGTTLAVNAGGHDGLRLVYRQGGLSSLRDYRDTVADVLARPDRPNSDILPYLAVGAEPPRGLLQLFHERLHFTRGGFGLSLRGRPSRLSEEMGEYTPTEIAAAWQANLERQFLRLVRHWVRETGLRRVVLGGDVFANAPLVRRLSHLEEVESLCVYPLCGDPALASGAAMRFGDVGPRSFEHLLLGPDVDVAQSRAAMMEAGVDPGEPSDGPSRIAGILADGGGVVRVAGREAWALDSQGGRCVLCAATDRGRVARFASAVGRPPQLPGTALTLPDAVERCYEGGGWRLEIARFGVAQVDCTAWMESHCPAAVLPDGTARPLVVSPDGDPALYAILAHYRDLSGIPVLLALDLPQRGEPAPWTPAGALQTFRNGGLDALVLGSCFVDG